MKRDMGLEKLLAGIESSYVHSLASGNMVVNVVYKCGDDDKTRMAIADEFQRLINGRIIRAKAALVRVKA